MDLSSFKTSVREDAQPDGLSPPLRAMWTDARGDSDGAHDMVQDDPSEAASWVHAYLHRKEGDLSNARYWYERAGKPEPMLTLDAEWDEIVAELLGQLES